MTTHINWRHPTLTEGTRLEQLKLSPSSKSATAEKFTTKHQLSSDFLLVGVSNITLVLRFMKSNNFYYVQTSKVIDSKEVSC